MEILAEDREMDLTLQENFGIRILRYMIEGTTLKPKLLHHTRRKTSSAVKLTYHIVMGFLLCQLSVMGDFR